MGEVRRAGAEFAAQQAAAMRARGLLAHLELGAHARLVQRMEASGQKAYFTQFQVRNPAEFVSRAGASPRRRPPAAGPPSPASGAAGGAGGGGGARGARAGRRGRRRARWCGGARSPSCRPPSSTARWRSGPGPGPRPGPGRGAGAGPLASRGLGAGAGGR